MKRVLVYTVTAPGGSQSETTDWRSALSYAEMIDRPGTTVVISLSHQAVAS